MPQKLVSGDSRFVCTGIANARVFWRHLHHFCLDLEFNELIYVGLDGCDECPKSKNYFRFGAPLGVVDIWWVEFPKGTPLELIDRRPTIRQDVTN